MNAEPLPRRNSSGAQGDARGLAAGLTLARLRALTSSTTFAVFVELTRLSQRITISSGWVGLSLLAVHLLRGSAERRSRPFVQDQHVA